MDRQQIKQQIRIEIDTAHRMVAQYRELSKPIAPENAIGRVSRMDAINNKTVNEAALRKAEAKLKGLQSALERVDDPDFARCIRCKQQIPLGRILIMPHTRTCVKCSR